MAKMIEIQIWQFRITIGTLNINHKKPCTSCFKTMERRTDMLKFQSFLRSKLHQLKIGGRRVCSRLNLNIMEDIYRTEMRLLKVSTLERFHTTCKLSGHGKHTLVSAISSRSRKHFSAVKFVWFGGLSSMMSTISAIKDFIGASMWRENLCINM